MIKIGSIIPYKISPPVQGGEKHIYYFQKYISQISDLSIFTVEENNNLKDIPATIDTILGSSKKKWRYINPRVFFKLKRILNERDKQVFIIEHPYYAWLAYCIKKATGIPYAIHSHNIESERFKTMGKWWWRILHYYEKFAHRQADFNLFISEEDLNTAIQKFGIHPKTAIISTYGIEAKSAPSFNEKGIQKRKLCKELDISPTAKIILFNGTMNYAPNRKALTQIINHIQPAFDKLYSDDYVIVICGKGIDIATPTSKIILKGYVEDIGMYFHAADLFINPVTDGGGIKTKLVEALSANTNCISYETGAWGVQQTVAGNKLIIVPNNDSHTFAEQMKASLQAPFKDVPVAFFEHFNWENIARKSVLFISHNTL